jgi:GNAT superfamily N-acetyltransferase
MSEQPLVWRDEVRPGDAEIVRRLCGSSGFFSAAEIDIAVELIEERIAKGAASSYHFLFAEYGEKVHGYACYGPIPGTESSWDLYWIAVEEEKRGHGLGRKVQVEVERRTALFGGKRIYIWTSSRDQYHPTRKFYERMGYTREATLRDYYKPGEHLIIYVKSLD